MYTLNSKIYRYNNILKSLLTSSLTANHKISDVLTAGPGPPGCRQTTTMAEENVSYCTNIRSLSTGPRHHRFQDRVAERAEVSGPRSVPLAPQIVTSKRNNSKRAIYARACRASPAKIVTNRINPLKGTNTSIMESESECQASRGTINQRISRRSTTSPSRARKLVRYSRVASGSAITRAKRDSASPLCKRTTSSPQGERATLAKRCPKTFLSTVFHVSTSSRASTVTRGCPWPRANVSSRPPPPSFDSITWPTSWSTPRQATNTRTRIFWCRDARPVHSRPRRSPLRHHRHPPTTVSSHHHLCHPARARSTPRPRVWLVILLLIGFWPQVLQAPDMAGARHQPHRCQLRSDSPRRNDYWPINSRRVLCTSPRISNDTLEQAIACCPARHRCWEVYKPVYKGTGTEYTQPARIHRDTVPFLRTVCSPPHLYTPQCQRDSRANRATGTSAIRLYTNDTIDRRRRQVSTTIVTRRYRRAPRDSSRIRPIRRPPISDTPRRRRGLCRCRRTATSRDVCTPIVASRRFARSIRTDRLDPPRPRISTDIPASRKLWGAHSPDTAQVIVSTISRYNVAANRGPTTDSACPTIVTWLARHQDTTAGWPTTTWPTGTSFRDRRRNDYSPRRPPRPPPQPTPSLVITPPTRTPRQRNPPRPTIVSHPSLPLPRRSIRASAREQPGRLVVHQVPAIRPRRKRASWTSIFRCRSPCRVTLEAIVTAILATSSIPGSARTVTTDSRTLPRARIVSHLRPPLLIAFTLPPIDTRLCAPLTSICPFPSPRIGTLVA